MARAPAVGGPTDIHRRSVWWVALDPTRGSESRTTRRAVVFTADALNRVQRTVGVVPLSTGPTPHPQIVVAVCDQIRAVDRSRLTGAGETLSREDLRAVEDGVRAVLRL
jgi:mRNA interferase MazF